MAGWKGVGAELRRRYQEALKQARTKSPKYLARGLALGLFLAFVIPEGFHLFVAVPAAAALRVSKLFSTAAAMLLVNELTLFFFYPLQCYIGSLLLGRPLDFEVMLDRLLRLRTVVGWWPRTRYLAETLEQVLWSWLLGGIVLGVVFAVLGYALSMFWLRRRGRKKTTAAASSE